MIAAAVHRFWPTIAGAAVLIGAAILLWWGGFNRQPAAVAPGDASQPRAIADPSADYVTFAGGLADGSADLDALVEGLRKLAAAMGALEGAAPEAAVDLRVAAEHVLLNPDAAGTTEAVRGSLLAAAGALEGSDTDTSPLRTVAESIDRETPLQNQQDRLVRFFILAADTLRSHDGR
jgi:hypothetical protein